MGRVMEARDLQFSLQETSKQRIGSAVDQKLLYCFEYDPKDGRYGLAVMRFVHTGGGEATLPEDYDWENPEVDWKPLTHEVVAPALLNLAQQTAETFTGKIVFADEFGTPDWGKPYP